MKHTRDETAIKAFGKRLKEIRLAKGYTQERLAWEASIEPMQVSKIERGIINTSLSQIVNIANTLKVHPSDFFPK